MFIIPYPSTQHSIYTIPHPRTQTINKTKATKQQTNKQYPKQNNNPTNKKNKQSKEQHKKPNNKQQ